MGAQWTAPCTTATSALSMRSATRRHALAADASSTASCGGSGNSSERSTPAHGCRRSGPGQTQAPKAQDGRRRWHRVRPLCPARRRRRCPSNRTSRSTRGLIAGDVARASLYRTSPGPTIVVQASIRQSAGGTEARAAQLQGAAAGFQPGEALISECPSSLRYQGVLEQSSWRSCVRAKPDGT